jgi:5'-nucleotidase
MNILLTNDDGINSEGLQKLAEVLRSRDKYRVFIIAPEINRSGVSSAISIMNGPVKLSALEKDTWTCSGFPGDCVILGLNGALQEKPDLVLSGINKGENLGTDIIYSGTAAAARQASLLGTPAIALSLAANTGFCWDMAVSWSADHLEELLAFWRKDTFVNVNIPNNSDGPKGIAMAWPAVKRYRDIVRITDCNDGSRIGSMEAGMEPVSDEAGSDCDVVSRNFVSVSPVYNYSVVLRDLCPGSPDYAAVEGREGKRE